MYKKVNESAQMLCTAGQETARKEENQTKSFTAESGKASGKSSYKNPTHLLHCHHLSPAKPLTPFVISMANPILRTKNQEEMFHASVFYLLLLVHRTAATEFKAGGSKVWTVPTDPNGQNLNQWAESNRFQVGDSLAFGFTVLQVSQDDYKTCTTEAPIKNLSNGDSSVFKLERSGPYYFISGNQANCFKNYKLVVVVLADRTNHSSNSNQTPSPSPPPSDVIDVIPSPAPSGDEFPSPPARTPEVSPSPSPVSEPPPSGGSSNIASFLGCFGAFAASSLFF